MSDTIPPMTMPAWPDPIPAPADAGQEALTAATVPSTAGAEPLAASTTTTTVVEAPAPFEATVLPATGADLALFLAVALGAIVAGLALWFGSEVSQ